MAMKINDSSDQTKSDQSISSRNGSDSGKARIGGSYALFMKIVIVALAILYSVITIATTNQLFSQHHRNTTASPADAAASFNGLLTPSHHDFSREWRISSSIRSGESSTGSKPAVAENDAKNTVPGRTIDPTALESKDAVKPASNQGTTGSSNHQPQPENKNQRQDGHDRPSSPVQQGKQRQQKTFVRRGPGRSSVLRNFNASAIDPRQMHESLKSFYTQNGTLPILSPHKRWNDPDLIRRGVIPQWMTDYFNWHEYKLRNIKKDDFDNERWIIMQCLKTNRKCGGTSDRLKPIAYILRTAYYSKRILLIHWTRPYALEEFLVPPKLGFDWRVKSRWLRQIVEKKLEIGGDEYAKERIVFAAMDPNKVLVRSRMQDYHGGSHWYDLQVIDGEPTFRTVFHELWKIFFTPSVAVKTRLESAMKEMNLTPYRYTAAHCRVLYAMDDREEEVKKNWAENAVNCASELRPQTTIFFVSDTANATYYARQYGEHHNRPVRIATRVPDPNPPVHIDMDGNGRPVADLLDGFVDLYILASADCVTYNKGGFGVMGSLMGRNATCHMRQDAINRPFIRQPCHWVDDPTGATNENTRAHYVPPDVRENSPLWKEWRDNPIYLEPVE